jgi:tyrosinase
MSIDRRRFVRTGLGGGFPAVASTLPASAAVPVMPRMSLEEFVRDPNRVADLRKGVDAMKARKPSHPDSWFFQGAIHAVRADWIADAAKVDPDVNKVDQAKFWNQCPHNPRYGSADFLLWHRAYLHYFEGILRKASGNPVLSLPYWNYPVAARRNLPEIYRVPASSANPLFITQRVAAMNAGTGQLSPGAVSLDALTKKVFFGTTSGADVFGGLIAIGSEPGNKGAIERVPHDTVHGGRVRSDLLAPSHRDRSPLHVVGLRRPGELGAVSSQLVRRQTLVLPRRRRAGPEQSAPVLRRQREPQRTL